MRSNPKKYKQTKYYKTLNVVSKEYYKILMLLKKYEAKLCKKYTMTRLNTNSKT